MQNDRRADAAGELRLEYRVGRTWRSLGPMAGLLSTSEGGVFGYAALYTDIRLGGPWMLTPMAAAAYGRGDGKDLGGVFQFQPGLDLAYRFDNGHRFGVKFAHIPNAGLNDDNPGSESLLLTYTLPLGGAVLHDR